MRLTTFCLLGMITLAGNALATPAGQGKSVLVRTVEVSAESQGGIEVSADMECGERVLGLLMDEKKIAKKKEIQVALVVERPEVGCGTSPVTRHWTLPFIKTSGHEVTAMTLEDEVVRVTMQEASVTANSKGLHAQWDDLCREPLGMFVSPEASGKLTVAMAFSANAKKRNSQSQSCAGGKKSLHMSSIDTSADRWEAKARPGKVETIYALRVVAPQKVEVNEAGQISLGWKKLCREVEVGVLFTGVDKSSIGIVTAYLPNVDCNGLEDASLRRSVVSALSRKTGVALRALSSHDAKELSRKSYDLRLSSPEKMEISHSSKTVQVWSSVSCDHDLGVVVGKDSSGNLAISALKSKSSDTCSVQASHLKTVLPLTVKTALTPRIFPLKILGSVAR